MLRVTEHGVLYFHTFRVWLLSTENFTFCSQFWCGKSFSWNVYLMTRNIYFAYVSCPTCLMTFCHIYLSRRNIIASFQNRCPHNLEKFLGFPFKQKLFLNLKLVLPWNFSPGPRFHYACCNGKSWLQLYPTPRFIDAYSQIDMCMSYGWGTHCKDLQHDLDSKTLPEHNSNDVTTR